MIQFSPNDELIRATAEAFAMPVKDLTTWHLTHFGARQQLISDIASLLDNGRRKGAICLMEMNDIDPETTLDLAALRNVADQNIAMQIGVLASQLRD